MKHLVMWFPGIEILELHYIPLTCRGGYDLSPLASLTALKSLSLMIGDSLGQLGDHPIRKIIGLEKLVNLTSLQIHEYYMNRLPRAVLQLTRLESLDLRGYHANYKAAMEVVRAVLAARSE